MAAPRPTNVPDGLSCVLRIATVEQATTSTIELEGEWDISQYDATRDAVAQALQRRPEHLVLDLSRLSFIDSRGIHTVIDTHERCAEQNTSLVIVPGPRAVQRVFELCHLTDILPFVPDASSVPAHASPTTAKPGGSSLRPQRRRRSLAQATDGAALRAARK